ncbi:MAG: hypothetical protein NVS9B13_19910 [Candidatus Acidiferrum sp.]
MAKYILDFLPNYSDESLLAELRRVAALCTDGPLSRRKFKELSPTVSTSAIQKRFGTWRSALEKAGLAQFYVGTRVTNKMKEQPGKGLTRQEVLDEVGRVHLLAGKPVMLSSKEFKLYGKFSLDTVRTHFGSWKLALNAAGIGIYRKPRTYTDEQCYENLAVVWEHYGRSPN